ncbi:MAG: DUF4147 domain-containing protein [Rhodothermales bacterium]
MIEPASSRRALIGDAEAIFRAGLRAVQADRLLADVDWISWAHRKLSDYDRVIVVGMGKASMALAGEIERRLGDRTTSGFVAVPEGHPDSFPSELSRPHRIAVMESAHPVPDDRSVQAARRMLDVAASCGPEDLLLVLISGGGSSLCTDFAGDISLSEAQDTFHLLLESGADIRAVNTVRKHLSRIGGGRLAVAAGGTDVLALVVSDVVGDDLSVIASGPTVPDPTTAKDAVAVLRQFDLWEAVAPSVRTHLSDVMEDSSLETPDAGSGYFKRVRTELLGTNRLALEACAREAGRRGYAVEIRSSELIGEARDVGRDLVGDLLEAKGKRCLLWGGETTVTVTGDGRGGRNQELALSAALALEGAARPVVLLSGGTDGRDGPTPAAGGVVTDRTAGEAREGGIEPEAYLARNDAYHFLKRAGGLEQAGGVQRAGGLLITGPTHTNVMDLQVGIVC